MGRVPGRARHSCIAAMLRRNRVVLGSASCQRPCTARTPLGCTATLRRGTPNGRHAGELLPNKSRATIAAYHGT
eukprot:12230848-Prorocentrum_lima.AAC.1